MTGFILEVVLAIFVAVFAFMALTGVLLALILGLTTLLAGAIRLFVPRRRRHSRGRGGTA